MSDRVSSLQAGEIIPQQDQELSEMATVKPEVRFEEGAEQRTVTGWACKTCDRFYGDDERMARWCCATTLPCACGGRVQKNWTKCEACRQKADDAKWFARERREWDGVTPLYSETSDRYFFDEDDVTDAIADAGGDPEPLRFVICDPNYAREIEGDEWVDDLPDEQELDDVNPEIWEALGKFNEVIRAQAEAGRPLSWSPGKFAAVIKSESKVGDQ